LKNFDCTKLINDADEVLNNRFKYFFYKSYSLGKDPDWFLNPVTNKRAKHNKHWCDINFFDPDVGDIKFIWEPSRFAWAYTLARAYTATKDNKYAEKFWALFESWLSANQPNMGPNYACGQECAIRLMAMCFAFFALAEADSSTTDRKKKLIKAIAFHARRIEKNIDFAISTKTNHSLVEAAGLYTAGILFGEFKRAEYWKKLGKKILTKEGVKQIYPDGSYIQHSMNYHRLMLQAYLWVIRLGQINGDVFSGELIERIEKAVDFIYQMQDQVSGKVPNYGSNDGALILPLNNCDYLDYRSCIQSLNYLLHRGRIYESGPWDEDLVWLFGEQSLNAPIERKVNKSSRFDVGGYYTLRNENNWMMTRCHSYFNRPAQSDMLHLDLWWQGENIIRDSGTYMYNCCQPWQSFFGSASAHNVVTVNGLDQMVRRSRFVFSEWTRSKLLSYKDYEDGFVKIMEGEHYGYKRDDLNIVVRRAIMTLADKNWLVVDDILGEGNFDISLYWQLGNYIYEVRDNNLILTTPKGSVYLSVADHIQGLSDCSCEFGQDEPLGWQSLYYGDRKAAPCFVCSTKTGLPARLATVISLGHKMEKLEIQENKIAWIDENSHQQYVVELGRIKNINESIFISARQGDREVIFKNY
ncbi:MAG: alginate lyase family protein, partial [Planctomycetota bacterium]